MRWDRLRSAVWLLVPVGMAAGCRSLPELDLNPIVRIEHTADGGVEIEALGPLIDIRDGPEGLSHAFRPLYQHKANFGLPVTDFLAPFGRHFVTRDGTRFRFWPLIWSGETRDSPEGTEWDGIFFPFVFAGSGPRDGDGYFAFWPLGGRMRNLFGIDTYDFFLWPLFMRTQMDITEPSTSWTVLLVGGWTTGGPRDGSWRILPFYRRRLVRSPEGELRTDQHTVLWPIFTWGDDYGDSNAPSERIAAWPLLSYEESDTWYRTTVLWPFFRFNRQTDPPPGEGGDFLYEAPWPIFRWSRGSDGGLLGGERSVFRIWPLYSHQVTPNLDSTSVIWPIGWWRESKGRTTDLGHPPRDYDRTDFYVWPLWHSSRRVVDRRDGADLQRQLWPLFHWDGTVEGRRDTAFLSLAPTRHFEFMRPVDELYSFLWTLWRYRSDGTQNETRLLFDMVLYRSSPEGTRVSIPLLYSRRPEGDGAHSHRLLWGLIGGSADAEGWRSFSLAGLQIWSR